MHTSRVRFYGPPSAVQLFAVFKQTICHHKKKCNNVLPSLMEGYIVRYNNRIYDKSEK